MGTIEKILIFDTETQGFPSKSVPLDHEKQPHLVQLAALVIDAKTREPISSVDVVIKPDGWEIPTQASDVHGISTEYALEVGISERLAFMMFYHLWQGCKTVAHNSKFDEKIMSIAAARFDNSGLFNPEWEKPELHYCTMEVAKPIMKMPNSAKAIAAGHRIKPPKLDEALLHFTGKPLINAHTALADAEACADIYWALMDLEKDNI